MARLPWCFPTMPSATSCRPALQPGDGPPSQEDERDRLAAAVDEDALQGRDIRQRLHPDGLDPPGHLGPCAPLQVGDRLRAGWIGQTAGTAGTTEPAGGREPCRSSSCLDDQRRLLQARGHMEGDDRGVDVRKLAHDVDDAVRGLVVQDSPPRLAVASAVAAAG